MSTVRLTTAQALVRYLAALRIVGNKEKPGPTLFGGVFAQMRLPASPPDAAGSQYPLQHWSPAVHELPSARHGSSTQKPREFPARSSWPGR